MRLQAIKLAGFKSFVDPTTVPFPSNLCAVVGPNGCGKSNIIDAVRWVMGESSAKTLRGESMTDVIFNGSNTRKPVGQASIELLFDNTEGRLTGEYAAYNEISVKRQVTRDGQSNYFLNNQKCRRKDITDLFLGTGLGPRSYSIIEQGMISDLIEAKPEELRNYLEEAAGISKYKERRKETERRISHTKDNLDRLNDLREELERQLAHLERQAKAAERYTELKKEERELKAGLYGLRWKSLSSEIKSKDDEVNRLTIEQDARIADQRRIDAEVEAKRAALVELSDQLNEVQKRYYDHGTEIARIEDSIQFQNERTRQLSTDLEQVIENYQKVKSDLEADERQLAGFRQEMEGTAPQQDEVQSLEKASAERLLAAEQNMQRWQEEWDGFNEEAAATRQRAEVQQSRIEGLEQAIDRGNTRVAVLRADVERLSGETVEGELGPLEQMLETQEAQLERISAELGTLTTTIEQQREANQALTQSLDERKSTLQALAGRHASLEALQQAALGQQDDAEVSWLEKHGMGSQPRLAEKIRVQDGWDVAVETVLGDYLQAVCVDGMDPLTSLLGDFQEGHLNFVTPTSGGGSAIASSESLASKVSGDDAAQSLLHGILTAPDLAAAINMRGQLQPGQSVVTPDGIWMGASWLRVTRDKDAQAGVIKRQQELDELGRGMSEAEADVERLNAELDSGMAVLQQAESERDQQQKRLSEQQRAFGETRAQLGAKRVQAEQIRNDLARANKEIEETLAQLEEDQSSLREARNQLQSALDAMEEDTLRRDELVKRRESITAQLNEARDKARSDSAAAHQLALRVQSLSSQIASTQQAMDRLGEQEQILMNRRGSLEENIRASQEPQGQLKTELEQQLEQRLEVENELAGVRQKSEGTEHEIRQMEQSRAGVEEQIETVRGSLEKVRLDRQTLEVRRSTINEQLQEDNQVLDEVLANLPEDANEDEWEQNLTRMGNRIQRLGAINLAAIDEFKVQSERKQYLDAQNEDLEKALATLENAIRKIDIETRTKFKETFDKVNSKLQQLFPKLFGGGHAYLEMTGEDLLDTGVGIMARPPGKRNASIHLLSGGEKALTAIALVFSIFNLNPAPFCLLDEVDAPLDDANVVRYTDMVKEMSRTVQFIFITHNKIAMEMGEQLMGVTMHEPGVSRLVAVDVDEAVAMAAV
ncbi:MAG: chromosome segregation protein SMC [Pseudomonadales bacterium]|nr:chromosome segregation protein SMC [Pseudomonadales bacterium]MBO6702718.1 chromosome segregation protein SMC [Pseudomonadales bacterium]MBO7004668.1 chromosome segregation protein SMC [Pseudomonadales bacterium]